MSWVLPRILSAETVLHLPDDALQMFTSVATGIVVRHVNEFIANYKNSSDSVDREAASKLEKAFYNVNRVNEYLSSKDVRDYAERLATLQYSDISCNTPLEDLKNYRKQIISLLAEDEDFQNSYKGGIDDDDTRGMKTAYTSRLDKENLEGIIEKLSQYNTNDTATLVSVGELIRVLENNKSLFKNSKANVNKATVLRKAFFRKDTLKNILRGLDFLIPKLESGASAITWRKC